MESTIVCVMPAWKEKKSKQNIAIRKAKTEVERGKKDFDILSQCVILILRGR